MSALEPIVLRAGASEGEAYAHGGHVTRYAADGPPVLFLSSATKFALGEPIRGGVPVIFPWFGDDPERRGRPAHGFARRRAWRRLDGGHDPAYVAFELTDDLQTLALWPHRFGLVLAARLGNKLEVSLRVENRGAATFTCETALHTYLTVGDIAQTAVAGLQGAHFQDKAFGGDHVDHRPTVTFTGEVDRTYTGTTTPCRVLDRARGRTLTVAKDGSRSTVVWNPGPAKAARFRDLGAGEWQRLVCVESGNIGPDALQLAPGASHTMRVWIGADG
jgi:glucose-6-phosphate 1-epimerase